MTKRWIRVWDRHEQAAELEPCDFCGALTGVPCAHPSGRLCAPHACRQRRHDDTAAPERQQ